MNDAIKELEGLYNRIRAERWKDNHGKLGVLMGIKMCILRLKVKQARKEQAEWIAKK